MVRFFKEASNWMILLGRSHYTESSLLYSSIEPWVSFVATHVDFLPSGQLVFIAVTQGFISFFMLKNYNVVENSKPLSLWTSHNAYFSRSPVKGPLPLTKKRSTVLIGKEEQWTMNRMANLEAVWKELWGAGWMLNYLNEKRNLLNSLSCCLPFYFTTHVTSGQKKWSSGQKTCFYCPKLVPGSKRFHFSARN